jgi:hypothetical protein
MARRLLSALVEASHMARAFIPLWCVILASTALPAACGPNPYGVSGSDAGVSGAEAGVGTAGSSGGTGSAGGGDGGSSVGEGGGNLGPRDSGIEEGGRDSGLAVGSDAGDSGGGVHQGVFYHPGILVSGSQLAWLKTEIAAGKEPWTAALAAAKASTFAAKKATAPPPPHICCGTVSKPDIGCDQEKTDAETAYTDALLWYLSPSGGDDYGTAAIGILNNYATVDPDHYATTATCTDANGNTGTSFNTRLQSGWAGSVFPQAAEIMRGYTGSPPLDVAGFQAMLRKSYVPNLVAGAADSPGNWELSIAEALIQVGVFLDDDDTFNQGLAVWRRRVPAYFYTPADGPAGLLPQASSGPLGPLGTAATVCITPDWCPSTADIWLGPKTYLDGLSQETCRDLNHVQYGIAAAINGAETARIQGIDLYTEQQSRIVAGLELTASYELFTNDAGASAPDPGCTITDPNEGDPLDLSPVGYLQRGNPPEPTWEIALNHYGATSLPTTARLVAKIRPTGADHQMNWETLTHGDVAKSGGPALPPVEAP